MSKHRRKHNKLKARRHHADQAKQPVFHEALAASVAPTATTPIVTPDLAAHLREGAAEAWKYAKVLATEAAIYGRAIGADAAHYGNRARQRMWNRTMRRAYLSLLVVGGGIGLGVAAILGASTLSLYASDITSPATLIAKKDTGITLLDRNGTLLYRAYGASNRSTLSQEQMPKGLINATLAAEDPSFYDHPGFSWQATARAIYVDLTHGGRVEGGSTLTQQLVKNALLTSEKSFIRKYREILLSIELERRYDKSQILNMYLNETYYGEGSYGVAAAAKTYFHKTPGQLTLGETALLAGLPLGPSRFNPNVHPQAAVGRRNYVLSRMAEFDYITREQAAAAAAEPLTTYEQDVIVNAPHFVFYVLDQLRAKYGDDMVEQGGMTVVTSLDLTKQNAGQDIVRRHIERLATNPYYHVTNGALVSIDPKTGDIISMIGSLDYNAPGFGNVNVTTSLRQPGSSFKPFGYVTAFKKGWNGATMINDAPISLPQGDGTMYTPQNYGNKFYGNLTLRRAFDNSLNIPAIKTIQFAGVADTLQTARDMGITSLGDASDYGVAVMLGAAEVKPVEMAAAYGAFANGGTKVTPRSVLEIRDRTGKTIFKAASEVGKRVLDARHAFMISHIISDNASRMPSFPFNSPLRLSRPAAAKTGTTNDFKDNWTVGYTPSLVTAVWAGNNDGSPMGEGVDGITGAAPIWHEFMEMALAGTPVEQFTPPAGVTIMSVNPATGCVFPAGISGGVAEVFLNEALPTNKCAAPSPSPTPEPSADKKPDHSGGNDSGSSNNGGSTGGTPTPVPDPNPDRRPSRRLMPL